MEDKADDLANWTFAVAETSAGVYKVTARHVLGPSVEIRGVDPDELLERARKSAREMESAIQHKISRGNSTPSRAKPKIARAGDPGS